MELFIYDLPHYWLVLYLIYRCSSFINNILIPYSI